MTSEPGTSARNRRLTLPEFAGTAASITSAEQDGADVRLTLPEFAGTAAVGAAQQGEMNLSASRFLNSRGLRLNENWYWSATLFRLTLPEFAGTAARDFCARCERRKAASRFLNSRGLRLSGCPLRQERHEPPHAS